MIWFRRFVAIPLALLFIIIFVVMLLLWRVNSTVGNPHFYVDQLRKADIYNFIYDRVLPAALENINTDASPQDMPLDMGEFKDEALTLARQTLPPHWVQARVEDTITQTMPYFLGDRENFAVTVPLKDRVLAAQKAITDVLHTGDTFPELYQQMVALVVEQASSPLSELPFELTLTPQELESIVTKLIPQDWLLAQIDQVVEQVFPYLASDSDHFSIRLELRRRARAAGEVALDILGKPETYDYIFDELIAPQVVKQVSQSVPLALGITLTQDEVATAIKEILPQPWLKARLEDLISHTASYLEGDSDTLAIAIPLADRKAATLKVLDDLANAKLKSLWQSLPEATPEQLPDILRSLQAGQLPSRRPPGLTYEQLRQTLSIDFTKSISGAIINQIPDQVEITQAGLSQLLGQGVGDVLNQARNYVTQGWTYTDADLLRSLGEENTARLEEARSRIRTGFTFTEADLRQRLRQTPDSEEGLANLDRTRHLLKTARRWLWAGWILPALLLAAIGALGARKLAGKIAWAATVLGLAALLAYVAAGPVYSNVARPQLVTALSQAPQETEGDVALAAMEKVSQVVYQVADAFVVGMRQQAAIALIIAVAGLAVVMVLPMVWKQPRAQPPESGQNPDP